MQKSLVEFSRSEREVVAYSYELATFHPIDDPEKSDRQTTDWTRRVQEREPDESNWEQTEDKEHRIRNVTPLIAGPDDVPEEEAEGFAYTYSSWDDEARTALDTNDPRGADDLLRCVPLVPKGYYES